MRLKPFLTAYLFDAATRLTHLLTPSWSLMSVYPFTRAPRLYLVALKARTHLLWLGAALDPEALHVRTRVRLERALRKASTIPWWHNRISDIQAIDSLPCTQKSELLKVPQVLLMTESPKVRSRMSWRRTSGTSGEPFVWGIDSTLVAREITPLFFLASLYYGGEIGNVGLPTVVAINFPHSDEMPAFGMQRVDISFKESPDASAEKAHLHEIIKTIETTAQRRTFFGYPSEIYAFVKALERHDVRTSAAVVITTGQGLEPEVRAVIAKTLNASVHPVYSTREQSFVGLECREHIDSYHLMQERIFLEILDERGLPVPLGGTGTITLTSLDQEAMPLIRYRVGDLGKYDSGATLCACKLTTPRFSFTGRTTDFLYGDKGRKVPARRVRPLLLEPYLFNHIRRGRTRQTKVGEICIEIETTNGAPLPAPMESALRKRVAEEIGAGFAVAIAYGSIPHEPGKFKDFIPLS